MPKSNLKNTVSIGLPTKADLQKIGYRLAGAAIVMAVQLFVSRLIGPNQFGHFAVVTTILAMLVTVSGFGFDSVVQVFFPKYAEDASLKKGLVFYGNRFIFVASFICMIGVLVFLVTYSKRLSNLTFCEALLWCMFTIPFAALLKQQDQIINRISGKAAALPIAVTVSALTLAGSLYKFYSEKSLLVDTVMMMAFLSTAFMYIVYRTRAKRLLNNREIEIKYEAAKWTKYAGQFFIADILNFLFVNGAILLISYFADNLNAGYYFITLKLTAFITIASSMVTSKGIPDLYEEYKQKRRKSFLNGLNNATFRVLSIALPTAFLLAISGKFILSLYHPKVGGEIWLLFSLLAVQILTSLSTLYGKVLTVTKRRNTYLILIGISILTLLVTGALLIPSFHLTGAAIAVLSAAVVLFGSCYVMVRK